MAKEAYQWEEFMLKSVPTPEAPTVTLQRKGIFSLNRAARALLGDITKPTYVRLRYDRQQRAIGMAVVAKGAEAAYPVRPQASHGATWLVAGQAFCKHFGIETTATRRYAAQALDGPILVINLDSPQSEQRQQNGPSAVE